MTQRYNLRLLPMGRSVAAAVALFRFTLSTRFLRLFFGSSLLCFGRDVLSKSLCLFFCLFDRSSKSADILFVFLKLKGSNINHRA